MDSLRAFYNALSPLKEATWQQALPLFLPATLAAGQFFAKEREISTHIAFLESGVVRAFFTNENAQEYNKQFFVGPASIGAYTSLLTGQPNRIPQQALTPCTLWTCDYRALTARCDTHPDLERLMRRVAEYYFLEKEKKELDIVLLDATARYLQFRQEFPTLEQQIPQYHIASYLGVSATQLSRIRHRLARH